MHEDDGDDIEGEKEKGEKKEKQKEVILEEEVNRSSITISQRITHFFAMLTVEPVRMSGRVFVV